MNTVLMEKRGKDTRQKAQPEPRPKTRGEKSQGAWKELQTLGYCWRQGEVKGSGGVRRRQGE